MVMKEHILKATLLKNGEVLFRCLSLSRGKKGLNTEKRMKARRRGHFDSVPAIPTTILQVRGASAKHVITWQSD
jgi:hypothetical protein